VRKVTRRHLANFDFPIRSRKTGHVGLGQGIAAPLQPAKVVEPAHVATEPERCDGSEDPTMKATDIVSPKTAANKPPQNGTTSRSTARTQS
jgi:hypothetical protein